MIELAKKGKKLPRAVLLCNPHNPLGHIYSKETILEYCRFAERHNIHLWVMHAESTVYSSLMFPSRIVDEIYALSLFENPGDVPTLEA